MFRDCFPIAFALVLAVGVPGYAANSKDLPELDKGRLEEIEDLSEALANSLLDFSAAVRDKKIEAIQGYFEDSVTGQPWPLDAPTNQDKVKWVSHRGWGGSDLPSSIRTREEVVSNWESFLDEFSEMEDARFKVRGAEFSRDGNRQKASADIKYFLVGRDNEGRRRWVKGTGRLAAYGQLSGPWRIGHLTFDVVDEYVSSRELFSEVSVPAGMDLPLPPFDAPGNTGFVYHGATAGDLNRDGLIDLVVAGTSRILVYINRGDGSFDEVGGQLGLPPLGTATAPILLDYDNDGDLDLFCSAVGNQLLFRNSAHAGSSPKFEDFSVEAGVSLPAIGFSATAGDVNGDGFPDIYVAAYNYFGTIMPNSWRKATNGTANLLFLNKGDGSFSEVAARWGVRDTRWSYAAQFADVNADGKLDLYVANDFGENALYVNRGDRFEDMAAAAGVLDPGNGMGVSFGDFNNDGNLDLFVTNMSSTAGNRIINRLFPEGPPDQNILRKLAAGCSLFQGDSKGHFQEVAQSLGPFTLGWQWGGVFSDFDNDGWEDIFITSGLVSGKSMKDT